MLNQSTVTVIVKWSKTMQASNQGSYVLLPKLKNSIICPHFNFKKLLQLHPTLPNAPCFSASVCVTESMLRNHLRQILSYLNLDSQTFTFHTFRRSGATLAFNLDVDMEKIKRHGTWCSDAVNTYIIQDPNLASGVASRFQKFFDST